jgi:FdhD protein
MSPPGDGVTERPIVRLREQREEAADRLVVEAPLELRVGGKPLTVVMRTPGHDEELVRGFLYSEQLIASERDLLWLRRPDGLAGDEAGNVIEVALSPPPLGIGAGPTLGKRADAPTLERNFYASASCGVCGKSSIAQLAVRAPAVRSSLTVRRSLLRELPSRLRAAQAVFAETGGLHASGLFAADGTLEAAREDVGRHNALDKLIGWALGAGRLPLAGSLLLVSGRVSFEILQKAIVAGLPVIAAVSAPSSLAVDLAERFGVTLIGFLRGDSMNVYSHAARVIVD